MVPFSKANNTAVVSYTSNRPRNDIGKGVTARGGRLSPPLGRKPCVVAYYNDPHHFALGEAAFATPQRPTSTSSSTPSHHDPDLEFSHVHYDPLPAQGFDLPASAHAVPLHGKQG